MHDLISIGLTTLDISARPIESIPENEETEFVEEIQISPAGTAGGTASIAAKLGLKTALISQVGCDPNGDILLDLLEKSRVDIGYVERNQDMPTSSTILAIDREGKRPNFHMLGASVLSKFDPLSIDAAKNARVLHFAGVGFPNLSGPETLDAIRSIRTAGTIITCDLISPNPELINHLSDLLPLFDVFLPSIAEATALLGDVTAEQAAATFVDMGAGACLIKVGSKGALGIAEDQLIEVPARLTQVVDTTSCGDAFCAGTICGIIEGASLRDAAQIGAAVASLVAEGAGTFGGLKDRAQIQQILDQ